MKDQITTDDRGFLYGDGLFETVRVEGETPMYLERHKRRFRRSARVLEFPDHAVDAGLDALESLGGRRDGLWRVTVTRPTESNSGAAEGTVDIRWRDFPYEIDDAVGPTLTTVDGFYFPQYWLAEHKTTSWLRSLQARRKAQNKGFDEALMVSPDGQIGEASAANVFLRIDRSWVTPAVEGILPGVIREVILERARQCNIEIDERRVYVGDLQLCESLVLTSTGRLATAASRIDTMALETEPANELQALLQ